MDDRGYDSIPHFTQKQVPIILIFLSERGW
jgi:hypothetical protein